MNCSHVVATSMQGCGSAGSFFFFNTIGVPYVWKASQFSTSPANHVGAILKEGGTLDDAWQKVVDHCEWQPKFRGFSSWPYSLFWKQWNEFVHYQPKFIHWTRPSEDWARVELAFQLMRGVPDFMGQYHAIRQFVFGDALTYDSTVVDWQRWVDAYNKHNADIKAYFTGKDNFLEIDPENEEPLVLGNRICAWLGIDNVASVKYPDRNSVGGERGGLVDDTGWDNTFRAKWDEISPQVNW